MEDEDRYWKKCARFPNFHLCGCTVPCSIAVPQASFDKVIDGLYIGPLQAAFLISKLKAENITHIVDVYNDVYHKHVDRFEYLSIPVHDTPEERISSYFQKAIEFIENGRNKGGVLVHCQAGVSRSATIVLAYLIQKKQNEIK